jgi:hypothetical protein
LARRERRNHDWRAKAASVFDGRIELGPDLHRVEVTSGPA